MTLILAINQQEGFTLAVMHIGAPACGMKNIAIGVELSSYNNIIFRYERSSSFICT